MKKTVIRFWVASCVYSETPLTAVRIPVVGTAAEFISLIIGAIDGGSLDATLIISFLLGTWWTTGAPCSLDWLCAFSVSIHGLSLNKTQPLIRGEGSEGLARGATDTRSGGHSGAACGLSELILLSTHRMLSRDQLPAMFLHSTIWSRFFCFLLFLCSLLRSGFLLVSFLSFFFFSFVVLLFFFCFIFLWFPFLIAFVFLIVRYRYFYFPCVADVARQYYKIG